MMTKTDLTLSYYCYVGILDQHILLIAKGSDPLATVDIRDNTQVNLSFMKHNSLPGFSNGLEVISAVMMTLYKELGENFMAHERLEKLEPLALCKLSV